jgi:hypothetical protein
MASYHSDLASQPKLSTNVTVCHWSLVIGHWSFGVGSWGFGVGQLSMTPSPAPPDRAFPARMGASICAAAGLESIVGDSTASYEQTAVRLATHPDELARIRRELQAQRDTRPLFQSQRWRNYGNSRAGGE